MTDERCDILVVGAGVAGGAFAAAAGRAGVGRVVLVERSAWPREKVCGCCLNAAAVRTLARLGLGNELEQAARRLDRVVVRTRGGAAWFHRPGGVALSRSRLDGLLVERASAAGAEFRSETSAAVEGRASGGGWRVRLRSGGRCTTAVAGVVVAADGLGGGLLDGAERLNVRVARRSWFGIGGVVRGPVTEGAVEMNVGRRGYVGLVRLMDGTVNVAAALDPRWTKEVGGPKAAVGAILRETGAPAIELDGAALRGTPLLTRRREGVSLPGLLVIGDSAGYVEPFTGEGMAWGLAGAEAAASMVSMGLRGQDLADAWSRWHAINVRRRQRVCTALRALLRRPLLVGAAVRAVAAAPAAGRLASMIAGRLERPYGSLPAQNGVTA